MCVGTLSGVTSAGMVISSARSGTYKHRGRIIHPEGPYFQTHLSSDWLLVHTSSGNSSLTSDMMSDVFPTFAAEVNNIFFSYNFTSQGSHQRVKTRAEMSVFVRISMSFKLWSSPLSHQRPAFISKHTFSVYLFWQLPPTDTPSGTPRVDKCSNVLHPE